MIKKELFGKKPCGCEVYAYTLTNAGGMSATIITYGGILQKLLVPDRDGKLSDVVCGYDTLEGYINDGSFQGALIGRYGNRIAGGSFTLDGVEYKLVQNDGTNTLHGGALGFHKKLWDAVPYEKADECGVILKTTSPDGEDNFPGTLEITVTYSLSDKNELAIHYEAVTDKNTVINMTNHAYFNLAGIESGSVLDQNLWVDADAISEVNDALIPTGREYSVEGTPFDFRVSERIGERIDADDAQLALGGGYDHNYILKSGLTMAKSAELYDKASGRVMECYTDQPCMQVYSANNMGGKVAFKGGVMPNRRGAICLETQHAPDSPNHPEFPTTTLKVGEKYDTTTVYVFGVR